MSGPIERRQKILEMISARRHLTIDCLVAEFNVSRRTIRYDIETLSCSAPIFTSKGNGGGIYAEEGWYLSRQYLTEKQEALLHKLCDNLTDDDFDVMQSILLSFAKPKPASQAEVHRTEYTAS